LNLNVIDKKSYLMERRKFVKSVGLVTAAAYVSPKIIGNNQVTISAAGNEGAPALEFPPLPYAYDALEPYIDARTMEIHYDKHHRAYFTNYVNAIKGTPLEGMSVTDVFASVSKQSDAVRNNGGGYYNHIFFWNNLASKSAGPSSELSAAIAKSFGSFDKFKETFSTAGKTRFGSGWAWLCLSSDKNLTIGSTPNQDNPLMDISTVKGTPLLTLDVWEHAYYLKYQNKRADYIDAFWNVVNWEEVNKRYAAALKA
jgi:superoxide dismutase, Fe-Mn family